MLKDMFLVIYACLEYDFFMQQIYTDGEFYWCESCYLNADEETKQHLTPISYEDYFVGGRCINCEHRIS